MPSRGGACGLPKAVPAGVLAPTGMLVSAAALAGVLALVVGSAVAQPVAAHDVLLRSVPAEGEHVTTAPDRVQLVFDEPVSARFASVVVAGPDSRMWSSGLPTVQGTTVLQPLAPGAPAGGYRVSYRVVSADGHPVSGTRSFVLESMPRSLAAAPATAPPASDLPSAEAAQRAHNGDRSAGGAVPALPAAAGLAVAAVAGLATARRLRRRRRTAAGGAAR